MTDLGMSGNCEAIAPLMDPTLFFTNRAPNLTDSKSISNAYPWGLKCIKGPYFGLCGAPAI